MVNRMLIRRIIVNVNRHGLEGRDFRGEGIEESVVLSLYQVSPCESNQAENKKS